MKLNPQGSKVTIRAMDVTIEGDPDAMGAALAPLLNSVLGETVGRNHGELANRRAADRIARDLGVLGETVEPALRSGVRT